MLIFDTLVFRLLAVACCICYKFLAEEGDYFSSVINTCMANMVQVPLFQFNYIEANVLDALDFKFSSIFRRIETCL